MQCERPHPGCRLVPPTVPAQLPLSELDHRQPGAVGPGVPRGKGQGLVWLQGLAFVVGVLDVGNSCLGEV